MGNSLDLIRTLEVIKQQSAFAVSRGLNKTAFQIQSATRSALPQWLHLTRRFIPQSVVVSQATRTEPTAIVGFDKRVQFAELLEQGGTRKPSKGSAIAVPEDVKRSGSGGITSGYRPAALLTKRNVFSRAINGVGGIWRQVKGKALELLYVYKKKTTYRPHYMHFQETAQSTVKANLEQNITQALLDAIKTAKVK